MQVPLRGFIRAVHCYIYVQDTSAYATPEYSWGTLATACSRRSWRSGGYGGHGRGLGVPACAGGVGVHVAKRSLLRMLLSPGIARRSGVLWRSRGVYEEHDILGAQGTNKKVHEVRHEVRNKTEKRGGNGVLVTS